jgi:YidC/Oxa1 family membrane protein insertase
LIVASDLLNSPRAAKRLVDLYRIVRAGVTDSELDEFIVRHAGPMQLCLAIVVGKPGVANELFTAIFENRCESHAALLAFVYWTTQSMRSMKEAASLAPQLKTLQAKYPDDKQRQQAEQMALYKEHGVNPVAGCLPMLLQMPIWIALYRMLANAGELYLQPFIPGWISDLTASDPYYILPGALFISMFLQARLQPASVDSAQQKILQYGMPIMFGVMGLFFPSGLTLYMFTNNVLSALHSIYMNKFDKQSLASAAKLKQNQDLVKAAAAAHDGEVLHDLELVGDVAILDLGRGALLAGPPRTARDEVRRRAGREVDLERAARRQVRQPRIVRCWHSRCARRHRSQART